MANSAWFNENWFLLLQSVGIVGGLLFTAFSIIRETRARRTSDLLALAEQHRELWRELREHPELSRVRDANSDPAASPVTTAESEFLNLAIVHFNTGWLLAREGALVTLDSLRRDVRSFFSLPIPRAVWETTKGQRERRFAQFVDGCLKTMKSAT